MSLCPTRFSRADSRLTLSVADATMRAIFAQPLIFLQESGYFTDADDITPDPQMMISNEKGEEA